MLIGIVRDSGERSVCRLGSLEAPADRIRRQEWAAKVLLPFFNATKEQVETFQRFELLLMNLYRRYKIPISKRHQFDCVYNFNHVRSQEKYQEIISQFYEKYSVEIAEFYSVSGKNRSVNLDKIVNYYLSSESLPSKRVNSCFIPHTKKGFFEAFGDVIHNVSQSLNYFRGSRYQRLEVKEEKDLYTMYMDRGVESLELLVFILYQSKNISLSSRPKAVHVSSFKLVLSDLFTLCFDGFICFTYCRAYIIIVNSAATEMDLLKLFLAFLFSYSYFASLLFIPIQSLKLSALINNSMKPPLKAILNGKPTFFLYGLTDKNIFHIF